MFFWITAAGVLAVGGGLALSGAVVFFLPGAARSDQNQAVRIARWLPAMGFAYLFGCVLVFSIWSTARGKDRVWGNTWETPVLGNYSLKMMDLTDRATIFDRTDSDLAAEGSVASAFGRRDALVGVRQLEVRPPYLLGTASSDPLSAASPTSPKTLFFILDTRTGIRTDETSLTGLQASARKLGGPLRLSPVKDVYRRFRYDKVDMIPLILFLLPPTVGSWLLVRWLLNLRGKGKGTNVFFVGSGPQRLRSAGLFLCNTTDQRRAAVNSYQRFRNLR